MFSFTAIGGLSPANFNLQNGDTQSFSAVSPGTYEVTETVPSGWSLTSSCDNGSPIDNILVNAGDDITCVFTNTRLATVTIEKVTDPDPDPSLTTFSFTTIGGLSPANFNLQNGDTQSFSAVSPGTYEVTETVPSDWSLTSSCDNGSPIDNISVNAGDDITCVFTNTKLAVITITKVTDPDPDPSLTTFSFTAIGGLTPANFNLQNGDTQSFSAVSPGTYEVTETVPSGWSLTSSCDNGNPIDNIAVAAGDQVTCIFTNTRLATVTIEKVTDPAPDPSLTTFSFTAIGGLSPANFNLQNGDTQSFSGVSPGTYEVTETVPSGWSLTSSCDNGSAIDNILVNAGDDITCVFTNTAALGTIIVEKVTSPAGDPTNFTFNPGGGLTPATPFILTHGTNKTFSNVKIGSGYSVTETVPSGWSLATSCDNGSVEDNISVGVGETVTCTFTNTKLAVITITKVTDPASDPTVFGFTANGGLSSPFNLTDGASQVFTGVTPGNYAIAETIPSGWGLSIGCVGGTSSTVGNTANLTLAAGDQVTCVFTNTKLATVTIEKVTDPAPDPSLTTFSFTAIGGLSPANFNLQNGDTQSFSGVSPGTYEVTETVPSGWSLTSSCDNGSAIDNILVNAGDDITCVFTNTAALGTIIVEKVTSPAGDPTNFTFQPGWRADTGDTVHSDPRY